ncbi:protein trichome birefringence-like 34 isoform X1 [Salvia miltiorrhiza]|uniref:protein trichome birefringence-like 34 isoform X1 n=1 Tax=Salvia miltiorrhiza TaxID=226208 RepID=UPI0025AD5B68|nr:protein trichome birefringence-like 34 isoform X1 [Salvia miltiorrhiza]
MWWIKYNITLRWGSFGSSDAISKVVLKDARHYEISMRTWSDWLELNVNRTKTKLFFMSLSPFHTNGEHFDGHSCYNETKPVSKKDYWSIQTDREMMGIAESTIERLKGRGLHVQYLNITHLSDYRRDAHVSMSRNLSYLKNRESLINNPQQYADCVHWCLPGVPDVWNIILYHYIINT